MRLSLACSTPLGLALLVELGCARRAPKPDGPAADASRARRAAIASAEAPARAPGSVARAPAPAPAPRCPAGMVLIPGGPFWVGSGPKEHFADDEEPRFHTRLPPFCLDQTEVTVSAYSECLAAGVCTLTKSTRKLCQATHGDHGDYPMNCVSWTQADQYCAFRHARLPSEAEWEFAARGGERYLKYPWGDAPPDEHACWKRGTPCRVKSFPPGAFDLYDMSGNVWEWTDDWYGRYPWPPETGFSKVYRGGSFSRRFEKWMHTRLRDRGKVSLIGSHLGLRCASLPEGTECPFGWEEPGKRCRAGVTDADCGRGHEWNGVRCVRPGWGRCKAGFVEHPGHGCVLSADAPDAGDEDDESHVSTEEVVAEEAEAVTRARSPEFDDDCRANFRDRPKAFRYVGGTHRARTWVSGKAGCKNRDVGVGWNSSCCP